MDLELTTRRMEGITIVEARGDVDLHTASRLDQAVEAAVRDGAERLLLDFTQVTFMDSTGLEVLLRWHRTLASRGGDIVVAGSNLPLTRIFEVSGVDELVRRYASREEALAAFAR